MKVSSETINFGEHIKVFQDRKTKVWSAGIPFTFPDGQNGVLTITRLSKFEWKPHLDIKSITINYEEDDNTTNRDNGTAGN